MMNGIISQAVLIPIWQSLSSGWIVSALYLLIHVALYRMLTTRRGASLTPVLGMTAVTMMVFALMFVTLWLIS